MIDEVINNFPTRLLHQYGWVFVLIIGLNILKVFLPKIKGRIGEGFVNFAAALRLDSKVYHLIQDVTIPTQRGTTQIDHVIVSKFGLFVIETKNYKGWIFANAKDRQWTQVNFKQKHSFQNPLRQNAGHICALSELLDLPKEKLRGVVCFMGDAKFKTPIPDGVFIQGRYVTHIQSFKTPVFSEAEVAGLIQQIESGRLERGFKTNRVHVQQLNSRRSAVRDPKSEAGRRRTEDRGQKLGVRSSRSEKNDGPSQAQALSQAQVCLAPAPCPKCGAEMVLRTAKRGANAGNQFWGCSSYPACRSTLPTG